MWNPDTEKAIERQVYTMLTFQMQCGEGTCNGRKANNTVCIAFSMQSLNELYG